LDSFTCHVISLALVSVEFLHQGNVRRFIDVKEDKVDEKKWRIGFYLQTTAQCFRLP
jgi:hypothetical protein